MRPFAAALALVLSATVAPAALDQDAARAAALRFGRALTSSQAQDLRPLLPERGKVRLRLSRIGPEDGSFGTAQVEAIFRDFLAQGSIRAFEVLRLDGGDGSYCLIHARASLVDRHGRPTQVGLRLSLQPESDRWVVREIKETRE